MRHFIVQEICFIGNSSIIETIFRSGNNWIDTFYTTKTARSTWAAVTDYYRTRDGRQEIWNSDAGATNDPPKDLVMKNQNFRMGANMNFSLINADKEEQANCQITRETIGTAARFSRSHSSLQSDEKCALM
nr:lamin [Hymenolepis microstoma]